MKFKPIKPLEQFLRNRKIKLIYKLGYQFFYDTFEPDTSGVSIPDFLQKTQRKQYARTQTNLHISQIIKNNALDRCYRAARAYEHRLLVSRLKQCFFGA